MTRCFQQSYTIKTPVTTILFDPIDKPTGDDWYLQYSSSLLSIEELFSTSLAKFFGVIII